MSLTGVYTLRRPDRFHTTLAGGKGLESWYDGKKLTVSVQQEKVFAQAPMPENIDRTLDALAERYDMALPLADLFYSNPAKALLSDTTTGGYAGTENVGDTPCHHLTFRDVGVEWEVWLPVQGEPLPTRFRTVDKHRTGQPLTRESSAVEPASHRRRATPHSRPTCRRNTRASPSCSELLRSRARPRRLPPILLLR